jgi:hypothetical protein
MLKIKTKETIPARPIKSDHMNTGGRLFKITPETSGPGLRKDFKERNTN